MEIFRFIKKGYLSITFFAITNIAFSNDTIKLSRPISIFELNGTITNGVYLINKKNIFVPLDKNLFDYLNTKKLNPKKIVFSNSSFDELLETSVDVDQGLIKLNKNVSFPACKINKLFLKGVDTCNFEHGVIKNLDLESVSAIRLHSQVLENLKIKNCKKLSLDLRIINTDKVEINISESSINTFWCGFSRFDSSFAINFHNDTIKESIYLNNIQYKVASYFNSNPEINYNKNFRFIIQFKNCYFDGEFRWLYGGIPNTEIVFDACTFGPKANLSSLFVDHLVIRDCKISQSLPLSFISDYSNTLLQILYSNVDNIKIDMSGKNTILLDTEGIKEDVSHMFKMLLEKFNKEGRFESYKRTDIQYRKFAHSPIRNFIEEIWWSYGYRKNKVFIWTSLFLILFLIFNVYFWKRMQRVYPIVPLYKPIYYEKELLSTFRKLSLVFLYTIFIFFSIGISFNRLDYSKMRFVFAFFIQYFIGLFCLVFILRAIIKI